MSINDDMWYGFFAEETTTEEPDTTEVEEQETEVDGADDAADEGIGTQTDGGDPASTETEEAAAKIAEEQGGFDAQTQARIDAETQKRVDAAIARQFAGLTNPFTGKPIRTEVDLNAYKAAFDAAEQRRKFEEHGVDEEMLNDFVNNHPAIQRANRVIQEQQQREANDFMAKEFDALKKEFPECGLKDAAALYATENGKRAMQMWANTPGVTLADAYAATHRAEIRQKQTEAVKQGMRNELNNKNHMTQAKGTAGGGDEIPADVLEGLELYMPGKTHAEYVAIYKKNQKNTR